LSCFIATNLISIGNYIIYFTKNQRQGGFFNQAFFEPERTGGEDGCTEHKKRTHLRPEVHAEAVPEGLAWIRIWKITGMFSMGGINPALNTAY
jgi:hypothetical protein